MFNSVIDFFKNNKKQQQRSLHLNIPVLPRNNKTTIKLNDSKEKSNVHNIITAKSDITGTRETQQDASFVSEKVTFKAGEKVEVIGVLCDGMGGLKDGEKASNTAVNVLVHAFNNKTGSENIANFLKKAVYAANEAVYNLTDENNELCKAGTTLVAVVICNNLLYWVSVGDSRIYIYRNGQIVQVTSDHNYFLKLMDKVKKNEITLNEAMMNPNKSALISYIGMEKLELVDANVAPFKLQSGDIVLLCSDGLTKKLSGAEILEVIMEKFGDLNETARLLPIVAFDKDFHDGAKSQDNTSVVLIQYI